MASRAGWQGVLGYYYAWGYYAWGARLRDVWIDK